MATARRRLILSSESEVAARMFDAISITAARIAERPSTDSIGEPGPEEREHGLQHEEHQGVAIASIGVASESLHDVSRQNSVMPQ